MVNKRVVDPDKPFYVLAQSPRLLEMCVFLFVRFFVCLLLFWMFICFFVAFVCFWIVIPPIQELAQNDYPTRDVFVSLLDLFVSLFLC